MFADGVTNHDGVVGALVVQEVKWFAVRR
jgi:hypothetical protein